MTQTQPLDQPVLAWLSVATAGIAAPVAAMLLLSEPSDRVPLALGGPILAVGLMGAGIIGGAVAGRFWIGVLLAVVSGMGIILVGHGLGAPFLTHPPLIALSISIASISFAARGALFARSASSRGWWIGVFVVAGEAALLATALARPGSLPDWLLALLPAQWATIAITASLLDTAIWPASAALIALGGTAAATLMVVWLWPRRWTYLVMFTVWLGASALVYHHPVVPAPDHAVEQASLSEAAWLNNAML